MKEWKIIEGPDYRASLVLVPEVIRKEIKDNIIPTLKDYPYPVEGKNERMIKELKWGKWKEKGFYEFKVGGTTRPTHRLIFQPNPNSKKVRLVWVRVKPFVY